MSQNQKIVVNGKEYDSIDEMPPEVRRLYESAMQLLGDGDGDGVPDLLQRGSGAADLNIATTQIVVDGRAYGDASELPPEAREMYERRCAAWTPTGTACPHAAANAPIVGAAPHG